MSLPKQNVEILAENLASKTERSVFLNVTYNKNFWNKKILTLEKLLMPKRSENFQYKYLERNNFWFWEQIFAIETQKSISIKNWTKIYDVEKYYTYISTRNEIAWLIHFLTKES